MIRRFLGLGVLVPALALWVAPPAWSQKAPMPNAPANDIESDKLTPGTFTGKPEGAVVFADGQPFTISYTGGTGNDVVLTRVVPPRVSSVSSTSAWSR